MNKLSVTLILATAGAIFLAALPTEGNYYPSYSRWNGTRVLPQRNFSSNLPRPYNSSNLHRPYNSSYNHAIRYPRNAPYASQNSSHNYFWGTKSIYDRLLYFTRVKKASQFMRKVTQDMDFPARNQRPNGTIYYMEVLDQKAAGEGGEVSIIRGGIGYKNVTFHFKSQRNKGFDFSVYVYGH
ncbi:unnamed protein product [Nezara viridula]|uniref:Salivary secreted peptide n=1 Tax=Nezara viridula TaxID=85310 RepID=A0A9P0MVD9_NEZVI|nr:unnamed protein product [Nezara viridula]